MADQQVATRNSIMD